MKTFYNSNKENILLPNKEIIALTEYRSYESSHDSLSSKNE